MTTKLNELMEKRKKLLDLLLENAIARKKLEDNLHETHKEIAKERNENQKKEG